MSFVACDDKYAMRVEDSFDFVHQLNQQIYGQSHLKQKQKRKTQNEQIRSNKVVNSTALKKLNA